MKIKKEISCQLCSCLGILLSIQQKLLEKEMKFVDVKDGLILLMRHVDFESHDGPAIGGGWMCTSMTCQISISKIMKEGFRCSKLRNIYGH